MKILMIIPLIPNTSMSGGQTRWFNIIKFMSRTHDITLLTLIKDDSEKKFIEPLEKYCKNVRVFHRPKSPWTIRNLLLTALGPFPLLVIRNFSWSVRAAVKEELKKNKYDLIHGEAFYVMPHIPKSRVPNIMVEQTIEYQVYKHYVDNEVPWFLKPILMIDVIKLRFWELYYWKKTDRLVAVAPEDKKVMQKLIPGIGVDVIPNGVDSKHYVAKKVEKKKPPRVMYGVTNFEWLQNLEAANELVDEVWPLIHKKDKSAKLWIVGRKIPARIVAMAEKRDDIEVTESISDARDAYLGASVMVAAIRSSGGSRLKVLEAMAAGLPIVSTPNGVAGLDVVSGQHVLVSNDKEGLATLAVKVMQDPKLAGRIGKNAEEFVQNNFDWRAIVKLHDKIYEETIERTKRG